MAQEYILALTWMSQNSLVVKKKSKTNEPPPKKKLSS